MASKKNIHVERFSERQLGYGVLFGHRENIEYIIAAPTKRGLKKVLGPGLNERVNTRLLRRVRVTQ